jgi:internalin A
MSDQTENGGLQEALHRIEEARRTGTSELHLAGMALKSVPESIAQLSELRKLNLTHNEITFIPDSVAQLSKLRTLDLRSNQVTDIPESITRLNDLRELDIARNQIHCVPEFIGEFSQLEKLNLYDNHLAVIPDSIGRLKNLRQLDLSYNRIASIPESLTKLHKLERLRLGNNWIETVSESLDQLSQLQRLNLRGNRITAIPKAISRLSELKALSFGSNRISHIPDFIGRLSRLEYLHLSNNLITAIPESITRLSRLQELGLGGNLITRIPASLVQLSQLWQLQLARNRITSIPSSLAQLHRLQYLDISNNQIARLPAQLDLLKDLKALFLHGNPKLGIPSEILGPTSEEVYLNRQKPKPPKIILAYISQMADSRPLNEAKLILVGQGSVGKTSLVKALSTGKFNKKEKNTEGIKISDWECPIGKKEKATVHMWDFGGQEMMHATHRFFLTQRSLYLLVLNRRQGSVDREADYWFRLIRAFGGKDAPVIVVLNKQKLEPFDVNREGWLEKYRGNIKGFVATACEDKKSITQLKRKIVEELEAMESLKAKFPRRWFAIKDAIAQMATEHISFEDYRKICHQYGERDPASQTALAGFLHDLGIALNYGQDPRLRFNYVLKPEWVTQGIYALLHAFVRSKGVFTHAEAETKLTRKNYSAGDMQFLLGLMERFELSFFLGDKQNRVLIPELLDDQQPKDASTFNPSECLNFGYKYPVLTEGLLPRFIARTHHLGHPQTRWKSGVILEDPFSGCRALVRADAAQAEVRVHIDGAREARRELLGIIRYNFDVIHSDYDFKPEALVYPPAAPQKALSVDELEALGRSKTTISVVLADKSVIDQNIAALIDPVTSTPPPLKLFLSYSHKDEKSIDELRKDLSILERNGLILPWYDRALTAGKQWEPSILNELNAAGIVVCQLSREYLFSKNCLTELNAAIERNQAGKAVLAAYVLNDCGWKEFRGLSKIQVLPKDGKPLLDWPDHHKYWRAVIDGIQNAIKKFQAEKESRPSRVGMEN